MDARLEVEIGADVKELNSKINSATKNLKNFGDKSKKGLNNFSNSTKTATQRVDKFKKSAVNGDVALTSFSRTIQDAPFGIMGVSNNITNLTEQFGYLKAKTGSAGGALKAMLNSLKGFGGVSLAISVATSALLVFGDEINSLISGNNKLTKSQKAVNEALNEFYGQSVSKLHTYVSILEDVNTSETQRKEITEELIKKVPTLTKEDFKYGNNLDVVRGKIGQYVLAQASRIEADTLVQENSKKLAKQAKILQIKSIKDEKKRISELKKFLVQEGKSLQTTAIYTGNVKLNKSTDQIVKEFNTFADNLDKELKPVQDRINDLYSTTFSGGLGGGEETTKIVKEKVTAFGVELSNSLKGLQNLTTTSEPVSILGSTLTQFELDAITLKAKLLELSNGVTNIVEGSLKGAFLGIGQAIGQAMAGAGKLSTNLGSALLGAVGGLLTQLGTMAITIGISLKAIKTALKSLNPAVAIGAGVALIALGSAFSAKSSQIGGQIGNSNATAGGGNAPSGGGFTGGFSNSGGGKVVFEIAGRKLVGVLRNEFRANGNTGTTLKFG